MKITFQIILTVLLFSLWAGVALLIVNPLYKDDLPGYTIGRICIWEYIMIGVAFLISWWLTNRWGIPKIQKTKEGNILMMNQKYGYVFLGWLVIAAVVAVWQFWLFSLKF